MRISRCLRKECASSRLAFGAMLDGPGMFPAGPPDVNEKGAFMSTIERLWRTRRRVLRAVSAVLLPPVCCLCGAPGQAPDLDLCDACTTLLPIIDGRTEAALGGE